MSQGDAPSIGGHAPSAGRELRRRSLTIDELARETRLSTRNIRSYQARGLLPPPEIHARTGYYGPEHCARLRSIRRLREEGLRLDEIKRYLGESD